VGWEGTFVEVIMPHLIFYFSSHSFFWLASASVNALDGRVLARLQGGRKGDCAPGALFFFFLSSVKHVSRCGVFWFVI
jgi:hypothetical protein